MVTRTDIINALIQQFGYSSYLEIGVGNGQNYEAITIPHKEGVDPGGEEDWDGRITYKMTSDEFFAAHGGKRYDLIFIDGLHHAEYVERDILNALKSINEGGIIVCHDLNPGTELMQRVPRETAGWTGDCWRAWIKIRAERPELPMFVLEPDYGVGVIYPAGQPISCEARLDHTMPFLEFVRKKQQLLPLVTVDDLWLRLGCLAVADYEVPNWVANLATLPDAARPFLVYCPVDHADFVTDLLSEERNFDVAFNDYTGNSEPIPGAEWFFSEKGHKWPCAARNLPKIPVKYQAYAFWDNDIEISVPDLNQLFNIGTSLGLQLYQASLTHESIAIHPRFKTQPGSLVRATDFVEIMMPVFSREGLEACGHTFTDSESGYGLDNVWPMYVDRLGVVDAIQAKHLRPINSGGWKLENGLTAGDEVAIVIDKHRKILGL